MWEAIPRISRDKLIPASSWYFKLPHAPPTGVMCNWVIGSWCGGCPSVSHGSFNPAGYQRENLVWCLSFSWLWKVYKSRQRPAYFYRKSVKSTKWSEDKLSNANAWCKRNNAVGCILSSHNCNIFESTVSYLTIHDKREYFRCSITLVTESKLVKPHTHRSLKYHVFPNVKIVAYSHFIASVLQDGWLLIFWVESIMNTCDHEVHEWKDEAKDFYLNPWVNF